MVNLERSLGGVERNDTLVAAAQTMIDSLPQLTGCDMGNGQAYPVSIRYV